MSGNWVGVIDGAERGPGLWYETAWLLAASELEAAGCSVEACNVGGGENRGPL